MNTRIFFASVAAAAILATPVAAEPIQFDVEFVDHIEAGLPEQDVYIERWTETGTVFRPSPDDANEDAQLFLAAEPVAHNPFDATDVGPFERGEPLDMTLGEWLSAEGAGSYVCENGAGHLQVEFSDLVPNGVYTLWHFFMSSTPTQPFIGTYDLPIGALDGSQSIFTADADGNAVFDQAFENCLQLSGEQLAAGLALNWHSDSQTYGVLPGDFGQNAHIQLFAILPAM